MPSEYSSFAERLLYLPVRLFWSIIGWIIVWMFGSLLAGAWGVISFLGQYPLFPNIVIAEIVGILVVAIYTVRPGNFDRGALMIAVLAVFFAAVLIVDSPTAVDYPVETVIALLISGMTLGGGMLDY